MLKTTFFSLPSELQNEIYHLVLYHHETGGIISPILPSSPSITLASNGQRYAVTNGKPSFDREGDVDPTAQDLWREIELRERRELRRQEFEETSNACFKHFCVPSCLLQHPLTMVNRQMREETLAFFYGTHHFRLEMGNFAVTASSGLLRKDGWSPLDWWRAIGDTNLRRIGRLSIVCHPSAFEPGQAHIEVDYRLLSTGNELGAKRIQHLPGEKSIPPSIKLPSDASPFDQYRFKKSGRSGNFEESCDQLLETMKDNGIHVRVLENLLIALEPCDAEYTRDHSSIGDDIAIGFPAEGRGDRAFRWDPFNAY